MKKQFFPRGRRNRVLVAILSGILMVIVVSGALVVVNRRALFHRHDENADVAYWTCPMHPQIHEDHPGKCPICHMDLVPIPHGKPGGEKPAADARAGADASGAVSVDPDPSRQAASFVEVPLDRQQLIGLRTAVAEVKSLHSRIQTTGRVAFDPELAIAIREYLTIAAGDPGLRGYAVTRLKMLGMGEEEIRTLPWRRREYESLYLQGGDTTWVYATLYQNDLPLVRPGMKAKIRLPAGGGSMEWEGTVRSVSPTVDAKTRNVQARIEIKNAKDLRPDMYVNVSILSVPGGGAMSGPGSGQGRGLVVPRDAVIDTGNEQVVYVVKDGTQFYQRHVRVGAETDEGIVITEGLQAGETVVASATFLIDSESRLRGGMQ